MRAVLEVDTLKYEAHPLRVIKPRTGYSDQYTLDHLPRQKSEDFKTYKDYGSIIGLPDQNQLYPNIWVDLTEKRQRWLFDCLCLNSYGKKPSQMLSPQRNQAVGQWASFMDGGRCFTNGLGWNNGRRDYIKGLNIGKDNMQWEPLFTGGNEIEIVGDPQYFNARYMNYPQGSYKFFPVRAVNIDNLPTPESFLKDRKVCHTPTTIKPTGEKGVFPQFDNKAIYPIWGKGGKVWIWERFVKFI